MKTYRYNPSRRAVARRLSLLAVAWLASVSVAPASVSNLGTTTTGSYVTDDVAVGKDWVGHDVATSFTVGSTDLLLTNITVSLASGGSGGGFTVSLFSDNGSSAPGSSLLTLAGPSTPAGAGLFTYTGSYAMTAGFTYWAVFSVPHLNGLDEQYLLNTTTSLGQTGDTGWSTGDTLSYEYVGNGVPAGGWNVNSPTPVQFAVNTTQAVPEPSTMTLFASGFALLLVWKRRRSGTAG